MLRGSLLVLVEVYEDVNTNFLLLGLAGASTISNIVSLQKLEIEGAYGLESLPESSGNLTNLIELKLLGTFLRKLPFGKLTNLQKLDPSHNYGLDLRYDSFKQLTSLREFHGGSCRKWLYGPGECSSRCVIEIPGNLGGKYFEGFKAEFGEGIDDGEDTDYSEDTDDGEDFDDSDDDKGGSCNFESGKYEMFKSI